MLSGSFHSIDPKTIRVDRATRQRRELNGISELAESIKARGQIHPVVVTRDLTLVAGERRLAAILFIPRNFIHIQFADELSAEELRLIELEENTRRTDLTWQERCLAVEEIHSLRQKETPTWSQSDTARVVNSAQSDVSKYLQVAAELRKGTSDIVDSPKLGVALHRVQRTAERKAQSVIATAAKEIYNVTEEVPVDLPIIQANFHEWAADYAGPKFNLIHCDFPYGINAQNNQQGTSVGNHGSYDDSPDVYWDLLDTFVTHIDKFADESCHLVFWFSMKYYEETRKFLDDNSPFIIDPFPFLWLKSDNMGLLPDPARGPRRIYETALFGRRGDRKIVKAVSNAVAHPTVLSDHMSEKPEAVIHHFFRMLVDEHSSVLDPTCGSGSAIRAAETLGARAVLGLERDAEFVSRAHASLIKSRKTREKLGVT